MLKFLRNHYILKSLKKYLKLRNPKPRKKTVFNEKILEKKLKKLFMF